MNTCCCRSNRDRYDPLACIPNLPRLQPVQNCRPFLEGRKAANSCLSSERRWGQLNSGMIGALAKMVNKSADKVCQFLHHLTLHLFSRILYPLAAGWNTLKIPFVLSDTCELYYGIYDEDGNLRNPIPTRTLLVLITMLRYFLNLPLVKDKGCRRKKKCQCCQDMEHDLRNIHNPGYCGKGAMNLFGETRPPKIEITAAKEIWAGLRRVGYDQFSTLRDIPSHDSLAYGYAPYRCPCQASDPGGSLALQSRRAIVRPFADLPEPLKALALQNACDEEQEELERYDPSPCSKASAPISVPWVKVQRIYIARISDLYAAVVQNQHNRQLLGDGRQPQPKTEHRIVPCRRSSGGYMPGPNFNGMPWSWMPRKSDETASPSKGHFQVHIPPYRHRPMQDDYQRMKFQARQLDKLEASFRPLENRTLANSRLALERLGWQSRMQTIERPLRQTLPALPAPPTISIKTCLRELEPYMPARPAGTPRAAVDFWEELKEREHLAKMRHLWRTYPWQNLRYYFASSTSQGSTFGSSTRGTYGSSKGSTYGSSMKSESSLTSKSAYKSSSRQIEPRDSSSGRARTTGGANTSTSSPKRVLRAIEQKPVLEDSISQECVEEHSYPDPEDYRREIARSFSRMKRNESRIPGESFLLVKQADSLKKKPGINTMNWNTPASRPIIKPAPPNGIKREAQGAKKQVRFGVPLIAKRPTLDCDRMKMRVWRRSGDHIRSIIKSAPEIEKIPERIFLKTRLCSTLYESPSPSKSKATDSRNKGTMDPLKSIVRYANCQDPVQKKKRP